MKKNFFTQLMILSSVLTFAGNPVLHAQEAPKNIIVLISDGWGYNQIAATNYYHDVDSQLFEKFPVVLPMSTYPATTDDVPDIDVNDFEVGYNSRERWTNPDYLNHGYTGSAPAATTMASGVKSAKYAIGVDINGNDLELITERAVELGKSAGVVTSVQFSHATPASFAVHNISRNNYDQIANSFYLDTKLSVVMGCGHPQYDANATMIADPEDYNYFYVGGEGSWNNLLNGDVTFDSTSVMGNNQVQDIDGDGIPDAWTLITDSIDFVELTSNCTEVKRVVGVPKSISTLQKDREAGLKNGYVFDTMNVGVPTLELMTKGALNILSKSAEGLFLMVEGGAIDWAGHANDIERIIEEQTDFNNTVETVIEWVEANGGWDDNLVIVTGDHETGYLTGPDYPEGDQTVEASTMIEEFPIVDNGAGNLPDYKFLSGGHTRQLIPFYAKGAGSELYKTVADEEDYVLGRYIDNTEMGEVMFDVWEPKTPEPKNVVVMISDGWGYNQIDAANYFMGETQAYEDWTTQYAMSTYPAMTGKVWQIDDINKWGIGYDPTKAWTDTAYVASNATGSAAAATAMYSGTKSAYYAIGVALDSSVLKSFGEKAYELGKSTGVITSVEFSHATPAAMFAHNPYRNAYNDLVREMLLDSKASVIMGCGAPDYDNDAQAMDNNYSYIDSATWAELQVKGTTDFSVESINGNTTVQDIDGDNVPDAWSLVRDSADFVKLASGKTPLRVLGIPKVYETLQQSRTVVNEDAFEDAFNQNVPTLTDMTKAALNVLDNNRNGFSLMIEGGAVDWAGHAKQVGRNIEEQNDFNKSVDAVIDWVETNSSWDETILIVTGDHECGYLVGPNYSNSDVAGTFAVTDNGAGVMPGAQFLSGNHTNQLIPIYVKGEGEELFDIYADQEDPIRGRYMNNTEIGQAIFKMWEGVPNGIPNIHPGSLNLMEDTLMALNNQVEELTGQNEDLNAKIDGLEADTADLNSDIVDLNTEIDGLNDDITSLNDSIAELNDYIVQITSVETQSATSLLDIYPTVTSGNLTVKIGTVPATIRLFDTSGNLISTKTQYSEEEEINLSTQSAGMYIINVQTTNDMLNAKIIKK